MIKRIFGDIEPFLEPNKVLIIYGPRRVGKTTILNNFLEHTTLRYRLDSGDDFRIQELLSSGNFDRIKEYVGDNELIAIDEAQQIPHIGQGLKIIVDHYPGVRVVATGSSSFDLANQVGEPLTGRKRTIILYPVSQLELAEETSRFDLRNTLEDCLRFGSYPEVLTADSSEKKQELLNELVGSYLFKDVLAFEKMNKAKVIVDLTKLLALQIGSETSLNELARQLGINSRTVERYLDILEKSFIIVSLSSLKRNIRNEIRGKRKYYFLDLGVRNAIISQFNPLSDRSDVGALWENFIIVERMKRNAYKKISINYYYWRTYDQKEIDLVEEREGKFFAYECKWKDKTVRTPILFLDTYVNSSFAVVNRDNYFDVVL